MAMDWNVGLVVNWAVGLAMHQVIICLGCSLVICDQRCYAG